MRQARLVAVLLRRPHRLVQSLERLPGVVEAEVRDAESQQRGLQPRALRGGGGVRVLLRRRLPRLDPRLVHLKRRLTSEGTGTKNLPTPLESLTRVHRKSERRSRADVKRHASTRGATVVGI